MKKKMKKTMAIAAMVLCAAALAGGCGQTEGTTNGSSAAEEAAVAVPEGTGTSGETAGQSSTDGEETNSRGKTKADSSGSSAAEENTAAQELSKASALLQNAINDEVKEADCYTEDSYSAYESALSDAESVLEEVNEKIEENYSGDVNELCSQAEDAANALNDATENLEYSEDYAAVMGS